VLLLVIQISGSGGAYPLQLLPAWFQNVSPFLPATHAIAAIRSAIAGTYGADYWVSLGVLALFVVPTLLLGLVLRRPLISFNRGLVEAMASTPSPAADRADRADRAGRAVRPVGAGRRRDATANRAALLVAAQSVLARDPHASLDAIAQSAGLSRRALYGHFSDRESLLREVIAIGAGRFNAIAEATDDPDPRVALAHMAARLWREASAVRASANIALDDAHVAGTVRSLAPLRRRVRELTRQGVESGAFRGDVAPDLLAFLIEETARATLRELRLSTRDADAAVVRVVLSIAGLSWREQVELLDEHPEILAAG
jgi:AcrR family transcriptional regulator